MSKTKCIDIDAVITWVDSSDVNWQNKINKYLEKKIDWNNKKESTRYNSINEIEITILSIIKFATYIKKIYLVTDNQVPDNFQNLKKMAEINNVYLEVIDHKTIFKGYEEYLPVFNSQAIETMLYRVPNLSENFVYFNDDTFLINNTKFNTFFINGLPVLRGKWINFNENILYKKIFNTKAKEKRISHRKSKEKAAKLAGFGKNYSFHHTPHPLRKSTLENYFLENENILRLNIKHRFRHIDQYVAQGLANHLEIKKGEYVEKNELALTYIQSYGAFKVWKRLKKADYDSSKVFMCAQSLETAPKYMLAKILKWIDKRLESKFSDTL